MDGTADSVEDWRDAVDIYLSVGGLGEGLGFTRLACMYANGSGVKKNVEKAIQYFKKAFTMNVYDHFDIFIFAYLELDEWQNAIKIFRMATNPEDRSYYYLTAWFRAFANLYKYIEGDVSVMVASKTSFELSYLRYSYEQFGLIDFLIEYDLELSPFMKVMHDYKNWLKLNNFRLAEPNKQDINECKQWRAKFLINKCSIISDKGRVETSEYYDMKRYLEEAVENGSIEAIGMLGRCFISDESPYQNEDKAIELFHKSLDLGDGIIYFDLVGHFFEIADDETANNYLMYCVRNYSKREYFLSTKFDFIERFVLTIIEMRRNNEYSLLNTFYTIKDMLMSDLSDIKSQGYLDMTSQGISFFEEAAECLRNMDRDG